MKNDPQTAPVSDFIEAANKMQEALEQAAIRLKHFRETHGIVFATSYIDEAISNYRKARDAWLTQQ